MDRDTKQIILPRSGATVTLYSYLSYGENRRLQSALMSTVSINPDKVQDIVIPGSALSEQLTNLMRMLVKQINLSSGELVADENVQSFIDNLTNEDGLFLQAEVEKISEQSQVTKEDKKKS